MAPPLHVPDEENEHPTTPVPYLRNSVTEPIRVADASPAHVRPFHGSRRFHADKRVELIEFLESKRAHRLALGWDISNTTTIIDWIATSNMNVLLLEEYLSELRKLLKINTLLSLVISSITSMTSVTQFTVTENSSVWSWSFFIKMTILVSSFLTSLITGYIKVEKIQERMEYVDKVKTKWVDFMTELTSQLQVGVRLRTHAVAIIREKQARWNHLNTKVLDIPNSVRISVSTILTDAVWTKWRTKHRDNYFRTSCSACTARRKLLADQVKHTRRKLGLYYNTNKLLLSELENLAEIFEDMIEEMEISENPKDIFDYRINLKHISDLLSHSSCDSGSNCTAPHTRRGSIIGVGVDSSRHDAGKKQKWKVLQTPSVRMPNMASLKQRFFPKKERPVITHSGVKESLAEEEHAVNLPVSEIELGPRMRSSAPPRTTFDVPRNVPEERSASPHSIVKVEVDLQNTEGEPQSSAEE